MRDVSPPLELQVEVLGRHLMCAPLGQVASLYKDDENPETPLQSKCKAVGVTDVGARRVDTTNARSSSSVYPNLRSCGPQRSLGYFVLGSCDHVFNENTWLIASQRGSSMRCLDSDAMLQQDDSGRGM